jgi:hypothetical protein
VWERSDAVSHRTMKDALPLEGISEVSFHTELSEHYVVEIRTSSR